MQNELQKEIEQLKAKLAELEQKANLPEKLTTEQWLKEFLKQKFTVEFTEGFITYYLGDQWIFQQDFKNKYLWCYYYKVWQVFDVGYGMGYEQIQDLHKEVVCEALNCKEFTPLICLRRY